MLLKYRTLTGQEVMIHTEQELSMAIRTRRITAETPVQMPGYRSWVEAGTLPDFTAWEEVAISFAAVAAAPVPAVKAAPAEASGLSQGKQTWFWLGVGMIFGGTMVGLGAYYIALEPLTQSDLLIMGLGLAVILWRGLGAAVVLGLFIALILRGPKSRHLWLLVPILGIAIFAQSLSTMGRVLEDGQWTPLGQVAQSHAARLQQVSNAVQANIDEHGLAEMLLAQTLGSPAALAKAEESIKAWDSRLPELERRYYEAYAATEKEMDSLPPSIREGVLTSFRASAADSKGRIAAFFQVEHDFTRATLDLLQFMQRVHRSHGVEARGEELLFQSTADEQEFHRLMELIQAAARREAQLQEEMLSNDEQVLQELRELQN